MSSWVSPSPAIVSSNEHLRHFSRGGYADWMVHSSLAQARDLAARAQYLVTEVRRVEPNVPHLGDTHI
jgi:hypothetical protein